MRDQYRLTLEFLDNLYAGALDEQALSLAMGQLAFLMRAVGPYCISIDPFTGTILREEGYGYDSRAMTVCSMKSVSFSDDHLVWLQSVETKLGRVQ